jgi:hypothetical protein
MKKSETKAVINNKKNFGSVYPEGARSPTPEGIEDKIVFSKDNSLFKDKEEENKKTPEIVFSKTDFNKKKN